MTMPEATVYKNGPALSDKSNVRPPGQVLAMEAIARETRGAQSPPNGKLRSGIFGADSAHVGAASRGRDLVHAVSLRRWRPHALEQRQPTRETSRPANCRLRCSPCAALRIDPGGE